MTTSKSAQFKPCHKSVISTVRQDESIIVSSCLSCNWKFEIPWTGDQAAWYLAEAAFKQHEEWQQKVYAALEACVKAFEVALPAEPSLFEEREI